MQFLLLLPLAGSIADERRRAVLLNQPRDGPGTFRLYYDCFGDLTIRQVSIERDPFAATPAGCMLAGLLHFSRLDTDGRWLFLCSSPAVRIDGSAPPLSLTPFDPESYLSIGKYVWLISQLWVAQPTTVPDHAKDQTCPICREPLYLAPVVRCRCGRTVHLQSDSKTDADSKSELDCFLRAGTCRCGIEASLEPQILPTRARRVLESDRATTLYVAGWCD